MAEINAKMVNDLRARTGAGMMDCKKALVETNGDADAAVEVLRKKGAAIADKKAGRTASQGLVSAYIHSNNKVGVLIEVACESDFVAKNADFQSFVKDLCMHIAAVAPICISREEVPAELVAKEREIAMAQLAEDKKPDNIKEKIVEGKLDKYYKSVCLLEQPFVKDDSHTVKEVLTNKIATIGEKLEIKRFTRYQIG
ncbi:translation elongation factor Ts [Intestinicryptomonas porci]|uniref:Elongation factor Ts n=1 Tax=Intestinicryptomonas porci TaxID=2926320 RepID=A0ABU4WIQ8_9BACT|nr:translation elongation factor Ts [Opitutales bacterium CLA-KB-P66]